METSIYNDKPRMLDIPAHPIADIFPMLEGDAFDQIAEDIRERGLREPIITFEGKILDGRNRYRALCKLAETGAKLGPGWGARAGETADHIMVDLDHGLNRLIRGYFVDRSGDPLAFVISKNLRRRHLDDDQRAMVAARIANLSRGRPKKVDPENPHGRGLSTAEAATMINVAPREVERAKSVIAKAEPEIVKAADAGKLRVSEAERASKLSPETQRAIAAKADAGQANVVRTVIKQEVTSRPRGRIGGQATGAARCALRRDLCRPRMAVRALQPRDGHRTGPPTIITRPARPRSSRRARSPTSPPTDCALCFGRSASMLPQGASR